jgi:hypothetical protein
MLRGLRYMVAFLNFVTGDRPGGGSDHASRTAVISRTAA